MRKPEGGMKVQRIVKIFVCNTVDLICVCESREQDEDFFEVYVMDLNGHNPVFEKEPILKYSFALVGFEN